MNLLSRVDRVMRRLEWVPNYTILVAIVLVAVQASERDPPFELLSVESAVSRPGEEVTIRGHVWRDHARECSADVHRSFHDSSGQRWDYPSAHFSADAIAKTEARTPGRIASMFLIPETAAPGPAEIVTSLEYRCNKTHALWPIELMHTLPLVILP